MLCYELYVGLGGHYELGLEDGVSGKFAQLILKVLAPACIVMVTAAPA